MPPNPRDLVPVPRIATGRVIPGPGVPLLLLAMTCRIGRAIDRSRSLDRGLRSARPEERGGIAEQRAILSSRARLLRRAITLGAIAVRRAALPVIRVSRPRRSVRRRGPDRGDLRRVPSAR